MSRFVHHCLNIQEIKALIEYKKTKKLPDNYVANQIFLKAEEWEDKLSLLSYFLGKALLSDWGGNEEKMLDTIDEVYTFPNQMFVFLQEINEEFIEFMLRNTRQENVTLDDALSDIQRKIGEFDYSRRLR